jgi:hypothetical protein
MLRINGAFLKYAIGANSAKLMHIPSLVIENWPPDWQETKKST